MADARLLTLARAAVRDPGQRARALLERVRVGMVDENLLRLAAHLGTQSLERWAMPRELEPV